MRSHGESVGAWLMSKDVDKVNHLPTSSYDRHLFPDAPLDNKRALEEKENLRKHILVNRSVEENKYRGEIFHMINLQQALQEPTGTAASNSESNNDIMSISRAPTTTIRSFEVESDEVDFSKPGPTPWITDYQVKGMQRSMRVERSEMINILKLELFDPPTKAKESRAQRDRRATRGNDNYSDDSSSSCYRGGRHRDTAPTDLSSSEEVNSTYAGRFKGSGRRDTVSAAWSSDDSSSGSYRGSRHRDTYGKPSVRPKLRYAPGNAMVQYDQTYGISKDDRDLIRSFAKVLISNDHTMKTEGGVACDRKHGSTKAIVDSGAMRSVVNNVDLLSLGTYKLLPKGSARISGIVGDKDLSMTGEGNLLSPFGSIRAYHNAEVTANILSFRDLLQIYFVRIVDQNLPTESLLCTNRTNASLPSLSIPVDPVTGYWVYDFNQPPSTSKGGIRLNSILTGEIRRDDVWSGIPVRNRERIEKVRHLHMSLSYPSLQAMRRLIGLRGQYGLTQADIDLYEEIHNSECLGCGLGKSKAEAASTSDRPPTTKVGEIVHADVAYITAPDSQSLYLITKDDFSGYNVTVPLRSRKAEIIADAIVEVNNVYRSYGRSIGKLRTDNEASFTSNTFRRRLDDLDIRYEYATANRHARKAERVIQQIKRGFTATLAGLNYRLPSSLYDELMIYVTMSINLLTNDNNPTYSAREIFTGCAASFHDYHRVEFGQLVATHKILRRHDVDLRADLGIIVNRDMRSLGAACILDLESREIRSRHDYKPMAWTGEHLRRLYQISEPSGVRRGDEKVTFGIKDGEREILIEDFENDRLQDGDSTTSIVIKPTVQSNLPVPLGTDKPTVQFGQNSPEEEEQPMDPDLSTMQTDNNSLRERRMGGGHHDKPQESMETEEDIFIKSRTDNSAKSQLEPDESPMEVHKALRTSGRIRKAPDRYTINHSFGPPANGSSFDVLEEVVKILNLSIAKSNREHGVDTTMEAVMQEVNQLIEQKVWLYRDPEQWGGHVLPSSLFLKAKFSGDGVFEKLKARLVAHGNHQILEEVFGADSSSPTINIAVVNMMVAMVAKQRLVMRAIDIKGAYLNATLPKVEVMRLNRDIANIMVKSDPSLEKYVRRDGSIHVELQKALYGLKTAGKEWYLLLSSKLESWGYMRSVYEPCLFTKGSTKIAVYVDDLLVIDEDPKKIDDLQDLLRKEFRDITVKAGDKISFLGMTIAKTINGDCVIGQQAYAHEISQAYVTNSTSKRAPKSPANRNTRSYNPKCEPCDPGTYRSEVMKFLYLATRTRPDLLYATAVLASRANNPTVDDFNKLSRMAQHVHATSGDTIRFSHEGNFEITGFADASFASHSDAKGHSGYAIFIDDISAAIACKSIKQRSVAHSSMEAELIALHDMLRHILWVRDVADELNIRKKKSDPIRIAQDNVPAINAVTSDMGSLQGRSKFIDRRLFTVHEYIANGQIEVYHCGTDDMVADLLTKSIIGQRAHRFKVILMGGANE